MEHGLHDVQGGARGEGPEAQGGGPGADHAGRGALRALLALHPLRARGHRHQQLRVREPRRPHRRSRPSRTGPSTHNYAGNLADVCPVGALLSHDFRFKMRVWFLEETDVGLPRLLHRLQHLRRPPRRRGAPPAPAAQRRGQQVLDVRHRPAWSTRRSRSTRASRARACSAAASWEGAAARRRPGRAGRPAARGGRRQRVRGHAAGHQRGPVRVPRAGRARGRHARLPRGRPAGQGPRARGRRAAARRPQPQHAGLPGPGPGPRRRRPRSWPPAPPGAGEGAACCRGPELLRLPEAADALAPGPVRRGDGHPRGPGAGPRPPRAAGRRVGRGGRHLHELPAPRAAHPPRGARPGRRAAALGAGGRRAAAAGRAARRRLGARGLRAAGRGGARLRGPRLRRAGRDRPRAWTPAAPPRRATAEARA